MDLGLTGKIAVVTASSKGIGRACALELAANGADLVICARGDDALFQTQDEIQAATGRRVIALRADLASEKDIDALIAGALTDLGRIDILVTNAGGPPSGRFMDFDDDAWRNAFEFNLLSVVRLCRAVVPLMREAGGGSIVNLASVSVKQPIEGLILSNSIRAGVVGLSKTLANELGPDHIRVNVVCPGFTATDRMKELISARADREGRSYEEIAATFYSSVPLGGFAELRDIARMVTFLASDCAGYVSGVTIQVDGGFVKGLM